MNFQFKVYITEYDPDQSSYQSNQLITPAFVRGANMNMTSINHIQGYTYVELDINLQANNLNQAFNYIKTELSKIPKGFPQPGVTAYYIVPI